MGGNFNDLGGVSSTTGFSLYRPYDHVTVTYDALDRVTSAIYFKDVAETITLQSFTITYSPDGWPIENGTEYKNHQFDIYRGRFVLVSSGGSTGDEDQCCGFTQIVRGTCKQVFNNCGQDFELITNSEKQVVIWPTAAEKITIVSTSSDDDITGIGIRTVLITGIDGSGAEITETISMSGTTPVISTLDFLRINAVEGVTSGSNEVAAGLITFTNASSNLLDSICAGFSRSASLKYTIPTSNQLAVKAFRMTADRLGEYEVKLMIWGRTPDVPPYAYIHTVVNSHSDLHLFPGELTLSAETDFAAVIRKRSGKNGAASLFSAELLGNQSIVI